jgi:hypothetical protein
LATLGKKLNKQTLFLWGNKNCKIVYFYVRFGNFTSSFASQWVFNMDHTVWQEAARSANTCIPHSFLGNVPARGIATSKSTFSRRKKIAESYILMIYDRWHYQSQV